MPGIVMRTEKQNTGAAVRSADHPVRRRDRTEILTQLRASMKQRAESIFDAASAHYNLGMLSRFGALSYTQEKQENVGQGHQANESSVVKKVAIIQRIRNNVVQRCGSGGDSSDSVPDSLLMGEANTRVYLGIAHDGTSNYVGITNDILRRQTEHGDRFDYLREITDQPITRRQARAIEQAMIELNSQFSNKINSISSSRDWYADAITWAKKWLKDHGYL